MLPVSIRYVGAGGAAQASALRRCGDTPMLPTRRGRSPVLTLKAAP